MKKFFKITCYSTLTITSLAFFFGVYKYQTDEVLRAMIQNDEAKLMYHPTKEIDPLIGFNFEEFKIKVNDSIYVYSYFLKPTKKKKGNIFFIHGGGRNATFWVRAFKPLIDDGYAVYASDWRGAGKSNGSPNYITVLEDIKACFKDFNEKTQNEDIKTLVYGMSLGGQLAVDITKENEVAVDALVIDGSLASAQQIAIDYAPFNFLKNRAKNHPEKFNQLYVASRDIKEIKNTPKLIIHSTLDNDVPFHHGEILFKNANEPKEFWKTKTPHVGTLTDLPNKSIKKINDLLKNTSNK